MAELSLEFELALREAARITAHTQERELDLSDFRGEFTPQNHDAIFALLRECVLAQTGGDRSLIRADPQLFQLYSKRFQCLHLALVSTAWLASPDSPDPDGVLTTLSTKVQLVFLSADGLEPDAPVVPHQELEERRAAEQAALLGQQITDTRRAWLTDLTHKLGQVLASSKQPEVLAQYLEVRGQRRHLELDEIIELTLKAGLELTSNKVFKVKKTS